MTPKPNKSLRPIELKSLHLKHSEYPPQVQVAIKKGLTILLDSPKFPTIPEFICLAENASKEVLGLKKKKSLHQLEKLCDEIKEVTAKIITWSEKKTKKLEKLTGNYPDHLRIALEIPGHDIRTNLAIFLAAFESLIEQLNSKSRSETMLKVVEELCLPKIIKNLPLYQTLIKQIGFILSEGMSNFQGYVAIKEFADLAPAKDIYVSRYRHCTTAGHSKIERIQLAFQIEPEISDLTTTEHFILHQYLRNAKRFASQQVLCKAMKIEGVRVLGVIDDGLGVYDGNERSPGFRGNPIRSAELSKIFQHFSSSGGGLGLDAVAFSAKLSTGIPIVISKTDTGTFIGQDLGSGKDIQKLSPTLISAIIENFSPQTQTGASFIYLSFKA